MAKTVLGDRTPVFDTEEVIRQRQELAENTKKIVPKRTLEEAKKIITANKGEIKTLPKIDTTIDRKNRPKTEFKATRPYIYTPSNIRTGQVSYGLDFEYTKTPDEFINKNSPFSSYRITSKSGARKPKVAGASRNHAGIDREMPAGTNITLPMDTVFLGAGYDSARGNWIEVKDESGNVLHYQHLQDYGSFTPGQKITKGQAIARSGSSGVGSGAHLHEEYYSADGRNITESYWAKYAPSTYTAKSSAIKQIMDNLEKNKETDEEYYNRRYKEEVARLTKEGHFGPIGATADNIVLKEMRERPDIPIAFTTEDGQKVTWQELYDDALLTEYENSIDATIDINKYGNYEKKDVEYTYIDGDLPWASDKNAELYNYINGDEEARGAGERWNFYQSGTDDSLKNKYFTEEEKKRFNAIWKVQGPEKAIEYADRLESVLRTRRIAAEKEYYSQMAKDSPAASSVVSVADNFKNNFYALPFMLGDYLEDGSIEPNDSLYTGRRRVQTIRGTTEENIDNDIGKFLYRHGMNIADNVTAMAAGGFGKFSGASKLIQLGTQISGGVVDTAIEAKERGLSNNQALGLAVIAGAAEYYFESKSFDALFDTKNLKKSAWGYFVNNLKQEEIGELSTEAVNDVADFLISQDQNKLNIEFEKYKANGLSDKEAFGKVVGDTLIKYLDIAGGTLLSTGVISGAPAAVEAYSQYNYNKNEGKNTHTPEMKKIIKEYTDAVDNDLVEFSEYAKKHTKDNKTTYTISEVSKRAVSDIKRITNIDVSGYEHSIKTNSIRHIEKNHGVNGTTDQSMSDVNDLGRIGYVLENYDSVEMLDDVSKEYRDKNQKPAPIIRYSKRVNGTYYVVEAVPDTKKKELAVVSAYKKTAEQQTRDASAPARNARNASADAVKNSISQSQQSVNNSQESDKVAFGRVTGGENLSNSLKNMSPEELSKVKTAFANINEKAKSGVYDNMTDEQFNSDSDVKTVRDMVHFSISPDFASNYDQWVKDGRPDRKNITVGRTSKALQSIGVKEQRITWDTSKINDSLKKHKYLDDGIMKQIPQLIENPIIVMQSKGHDSRITMFGEVYDGDGLPVMAVLELLPQNYAKTLVLDEIKVTSTHSRKNLNKPADMTQTQNIIDTSEILYVEPNKNRTDNWLTLNRLQLPLSVTNYGSINKISYPNEIVNSNSSILPTKSDNVRGDSRNFGETQKKFFDVFGVKVEMDESLDANAKILLFDGIVKVLPYADIDDWAITRHEFTHLLKMQYPEAYEVYARIAKQEIGDRWDSLYEETKKAYEEYAKKHPEEIKKVTPELIEEEVLSRYAESFDNNAFIEKVVAENTSIGAKIRNLINNLIKKIKSLFSKSDLKANSENIKKLVTAKQAWEDAVLRAAQNGKIKFRGGNGVMYSSDADISVKEQIYKNQKELENMEVIARYDSDVVLKNGKSVLEWAVNVLKSSGYKADRRGFGVVIFDEKRLKNGLRYMKSETDYLAYALIPKIIKQGIVIGGHPNHKGRGYSTITFAGPVEINGVRGNMAVVVRIEGKNYYKLHKVVLPGGSMLSYNKKSSTERAAATTSVVDMPTNTTSKNSIRYPDDNVNSKFSLSTPDKLQKLESENAKLSDKENGVQKPKGNNAQKKSGTDFAEGYDDYIERQNKLFDSLGLNYSQRNAILKYKSGESYSLNRNLRSEEPLTSQEQEIVNELNSALDKFPRYTGKVYRNIGFMSKSDFNEFILKHIDSKAITYSAFTSASKEADGYLIEGAPYTVSYEIESLSGKDVSDIGIETEREVLFKTDTAFDILSIEISNNTVKIKMKESVESGKSEPEGILQDRREQQRTEGTASKDGVETDGGGIYSSPDTVRGGGSAYDEIHKGTSESDSGGTKRRSEQENLGNDTKARNDGERKRQVLRVESQEGSKITVGMSDGERAEILKDKVITNIPVVEEIPKNIIKKLENVSSWKDINKYLNKEKRYLIHKIAQEFDVFKEYNNSDINISFEFSNNNFRESFSKQKSNYESFAKMFSVFDKVIENAVGIEVHNRNSVGYKTDSTLNNVYVLLSAFEDGETIVPVKLEVKEFKDKQNTLYVAISLEAIKKTEVSKQGTTVNSVAQNSRSVNISISDILKKINPKDTNFLKYVPKEFLPAHAVTSARIQKADSDTEIQTMYKKRSLAIAENADALSFMPETTNSTASKEIIPNKSGSVKKKTSKFRTNSMEKSFVKDEVRKEADKNKEGFKYVPISNIKTYKEAEAYVAEKGADSAYTEFMSREFLTATDVAVAEKLIAEYQSTGRYEDAVNICLKVREHMTKMGQAVQADAIIDKLTPEGRLIAFTKTAESVKRESIRKKTKKMTAKEWEDFAGDIREAKSRARSSGKNAQSEIEKVYDKYKIAYVPQEVLEWATKALKEIEDIQDAEDIISIIKDSSQRRNINPSKRVLNNIRKQEIITVKDYAHRAILQTLDSYIPTSTGDKIANIQTLMQLTNPTTTMRNISGNAGFAGMEQAANAPAVGADIVMSLFTGHRSVGREKVFSRRALKKGKERFLESWTETALGIGKNESGKYMPKKRIWKGDSPVSKVMDKWNRLLTHTLTDTDEFFKGMAKASLEESIEAIRDKISAYESSEMEIAAELDSDMKYRTFQDDNKLTDILNSVKNTLNKVGFNDKSFGMGDFIIKYTKVPGNIIMRTYEYSPAGIAKFIYNVTRLSMKNKGDLSKISFAEQRRLANSMGRGVVGSMLMAVAAVLVKAGIMTVGERFGDDDEEKDIKAIEREGGNYGLQINLSALRRYFDGEKGDLLRDGDYLADISGIQPLSGILSLGAAIDSENKLLDNVFNVAGTGIEVLNDLSMMQSFSNILDTYRYSGSGGQVLLGLAIDSGLSFMPSVGKRTAGLLDDVKRDIYHSGGASEEMVARFKNSLPFIRNTLPEKINSFGETQSNTTGNKVLDFINTYIMPGNITKYRENATATELMRMMELVPDIAPPSAPSSFEKNGTPYKPQGRHYEEFAKMHGKRTAKYLSELFKSEEYAAANDTLKGEMIKDAESQALSDAKSAYHRWVQIYGSKAGKAVYEQSFTSEFAGKTIVGNNDEPTQAYEAEGFTKGKGYAKVETNGKTFILQGDAYNEYEKARYDAYSEKSELLDKSGTMTIKNETGAKSNVTKMKAILRQLIAEGEMELSEATFILTKYAGGYEIEVPAGVEFIVGRKEEYEAEYSQLTMTERKNIKSNLKAKIRKGEMTFSEATKYLEDLQSGKIKYTKKRYITGEYEKLTDKQQKKVLEEMNDLAKEIAVNAVEERLG